MYWGKRPRLASYILPCLKIASPALLLNLRCISTLRRYNVYLKPSVLPTMAWLSRVRKNGLTDFLNYGVLLACFMTTTVTQKFLSKLKLFVRKSGPRWNWIEHQLLTRKRRSIIWIIKLFLKSFWALTIQPSEPAATDHGAFHPTTNKVQRLRKILWLSLCIDNPMWSPIIILPPTWTLPK